MLSQSGGLQALLMMSGLGLFLWLFVRSRLKTRRGHYQVSHICNQLKHNANAKLEPLEFRGTQSVGAPGDVLRWQVELHDLGRELKAELDCKLIATRNIAQSFDTAATKLEQLISAGQNIINRDSPAAQMIRLAEAGFSHEQIADQFAVEPRFVSILVGK